ncbi:MAG: DNA polymerase IV [Acidobacteriota bacterium]
MRRSRCATTPSGVASRSSLAPIRAGRGRGVVSAASYEARAFGVHSALPISQAYRLCPDGIFAPPRGERYQEASDRVMAILARFTPHLEPISVDEAFLEITDGQTLLGAPEEQARAIKEAVKAETGLIASVGVAASKLVAKIASDLRKPDGLVVVPPGSEESFLAPLPIARMWGIGPVAEKRLVARGITTLGHLQRMTAQAASALLGEHGRELRERAFGRDTRVVDPEYERKSLGRESTYDEDVGDDATLEATLLSLCEEITRRMRRAAFKGHTVTLKIRYRGFETHTRAMTLREPVNAVEQLYPVARRIFRGIDRKGRKVRLLGVYLSRLVAEGDAARGLFAAADDKTEAMSRSVDRITAKYGRDAITRARLVGRKPAASSAEPLPERRR